MSIGCPAPVDTARVFAHGALAKAVPISAIGA
jgi:hypothetical protein